MTNPHIETLVNFLRDFAEANADSFAPEQIEHLNRASVEIAVLDKAVDNLIKERDEIGQLRKERDDAYAQIDRYKNGYEGGCHACEVVAVRNQELLKEVKDLTERHAHMSNIALGARADVHQARRDLDEANRKLNSARWEVCELSGNGSIDSAMRVAAERGWIVTEEDDDGIGYDPHTEAWDARAEEGKKREEEYRKRHEERIAWISRVREEEEAKKRQEGYPPF
jgi:hypothetical protein